LLKIEQKLKPKEKSKDSNGSGLSFKNRMKKYISSSSGTNPDLLTDSSSTKSQNLEVRSMNEEISASEIKHHNATDQLVIKVDQYESEKKNPLVIGKTSRKNSENSTEDVWPKNEHSDSNLTVIQI
jgi:hypothetical protein